MLNRDIYAVVDLETTRTTSESGRIIQIAVAFVQNKKSLTNSQRWLTLASKFHVTLPN
ncbi:Protein of unknown function [Weissella confusa LBAE C39-2]|nr:Protein of unknown function [Weissella confusa LBAE C39-2]